ncbi:hypothetical protein [Aestuariivivens sediminicola]|uniref:hypothetical protein n=1 Tax=Aestuariivivens sediminicola TaxID=2913560 RepID=UPI001F57DF86|nr:hypothetical protein [Aestuariivivens sediminicola]
MKHPILRFALKAIFFLSITFYIHIGALKVFGLALFENEIILSYTVNLILVVLIFGVLYLLRNRFTAQLGFLFLVGSLLKFAIFFILFYPIFKEDGVLSKLEFASFFVPYAIGLIIETISLGNWLNKLK